MLSINEIIALSAVTAKAKIQTVIPRPGDETSKITIPGVALVRQNVETLAQTYGVSGIKTETGSSARKMEAGVAAGRVAALFMGATPTPEECEILEKERAKQRAAILVNTSAPQMTQSAFERTCEAIDAFKALETSEKERKEGFAQYKKNIVALFKGKELTESERDDLLAMLA